MQHPRLRGAGGTQSPLTGKAGKRTKEQQELGQVSFTTEGTGKCPGQVLGRE